MRLDLEQVGVQAEGRSSENGGTGEVGDQMALAERGEKVTGR